MMLVVVGLTKEEGRLLGWLLEKPTFGGTLLLYCL
jgi:hypothetical protein